MLMLSEKIGLDREHFMLYCDPKCKEDCLKLCEYLTPHMEEIMQFFQLERLSRKPVIYVSSERQIFCKHIEQLSQTFDGLEYQDWMIADTYDGDINILSLEACRETDTHRNISQIDYNKIIVHEFVHFCQQQCFQRQIAHDKFCGWFWEALATNLSMQDYPHIEVDCTVQQLLSEFPNFPNAYTHAYNIGKYMLSHMDHAMLLDYVYYPEHLAQDMETILEKVRNLPTDV